ncbi:Erythronolide synthase, modules 5 and 6 [Enhygromyxa salina]|uniref:Erythronolide synthase, modules 5 and 6 n=1 Tax=Enhygromyxa salina TaxID=215803 RepID=A0A2S9YGE1_9BACT|nr:type I polyketide synthase [Enhygromyxa salina]PRQ04169.1 Erythronolide synthase, modules 5 and 6 [Enhygromyxa salina]
MDKSELLRQSLSRIHALKARVAELEAPQAEPIAIVGIGLRFPAGLDDPRQFWAGLARGVDVIREIPEQRWPAGQAEARFAGMLDRIYEFEPGFFGVSEREARTMDPQQRLLLEVAWSALADAGLPLASVRGSETGVFIGASGFDWTLLAFGDQAIDAYAATGSSHSILANRLSYLWDLRGPSLSVDAACASSLVAVHLGVAALRRRECDRVLVGGVQAHLVPHTTMSLARFGMMAADGRCKAFDSRADGFVRGEGCGVVVLARLSEVDLARDRVYAVIHGSAVNQDGRSNGLTAPNTLAQARVLRAALADAGVEPEEVGFIETHGTGTALGDPIEFQALSSTYGASSRPCYLGAVKTNLGHTEAAAGVAGLIKAALAIHHKEIPANLHLERLNPDVEIEGTRFRLPREQTAWGPPHHAAVSSFGFGGTNAHVVLGPPPEPPSPTADAGQAQLIAAISAASREAFFERVEQLVDLVDEPSVEPGDLTYTLAARSTHLAWRGHAIGHDRPSLASALAKAHPTLAASAPPRVVFLFSGQGGQWLDMGRALADGSEVFRAALERCAEAIARVAGWSLAAALASTTELARVDRVQPAIFAVQVALAALWRSVGVEPDVVLGTSMGEVAAAHVAGLLGLEDAARVITTRSRLVAERLDTPGAMATVALSEAALRERLSARPSDLEIAVVNSPSNVVVAGSPAPLLELMAELERDGVFTRRIQVDYASHCSHVDMLADAIEDALPGLAAGDGPRTRMLSTVTLDWLEDATRPSYWRANLREPVRLWPALSEVLRPAGDVVIELSPHPVLTVPLEEPLAQLEPPVSLCCPMARGGGPEVFLDALGRTWARGLEPRWQTLQPGGRVTSLSSYPWTRRAYGPELSLSDPRAAIATPASSAATVTKERGATITEASIEALVIETLTHELGASSDLAMDVPLRELGLDSLMASHLRARLAERGLEVSLLDVLQAPGIHALVATIRAKLRDRSETAPDASAASSGPWFVCPRPRPQADVVLYCVPFGGGSAGAFRPWVDEMPEWLELRAVESPGRGTRLGEPWPATADALVTGLTEAILEDLEDLEVSRRRPEPGDDRPSFALYGHCSGSLIAYEVAKRLSAAGHAPRHLFVAALGPPARYDLDELVATVERSGAPLHDMSDELLLGFLRSVEFQGLEEFERDPELRDMAMATMRADSRMMMSYRPVDGGPLAVPITAIGGARDPAINIYELWQWARETRAWFDWRWLPAGNHYFHADHVDELAEIFAVLRADELPLPHPRTTAALAPIDVVRGFYAAHGDEPSAAAPFLAEAVNWRILDPSERELSDPGQPQPQPQPQPRSWFADPRLSVRAVAMHELELEAHGDDEIDASSGLTLAPAGSEARPATHRARYRVRDGRIVSATVHIE